jgi:hypothetical protein
MTLAPTPDARAAEIGVGSLPTTGVGDGVAGGDAVGLGLAVGVGEGEELGAGVAVGAGSTAMASGPTTTTR